MNEVLALDWNDKEKEHISSLIVGAVVGESDRVAVKVNPGTTVTVEGSTGCSYGGAQINIIIKIGI